MDLNLKGKKALVTGGSAAASATPSAKPLRGTGPMSRPARVAKPGFDGRAIRN